MPSEKAGARIGTDAEIESPQRLGLLDAARGVAIILMISYHFSWDLAYFGIWISPEEVVSGPWIWYARFIGSSFLFLAGFSAAYAQTVRPTTLRRLLRRLLAIGGCALLLTAATRLFVPGMFIYFGILHVLAVASVVSFLLRKASLPVLAAVALIGILLPASGVFDLGSSRWLAWIGLSAMPPPALDYYPLLPWISLVLSGMLAARFVTARFPESLFFREYEALPVLSWAGRNSLIIYMLHQPLLFSLISIFV